MKRLDRLKAAFLTQVSHKLKTPLTSLYLGLEELERYAANLHPGDPCHERLSSMRDDMAQFSKVIFSFLRMQEVMARQGGLHVRCDLAEIIGEALQQTDSKGEHHRIEIDLADIPLISAEHDRLTFALQQIFDNAFKFSNPDGAVSISLSRAEKWIRIVVKDNGCGISKEELPRLFNMSYQIDPYITGQVPGFGLGLFCAREIIRQHGGQIVIESSDGEGTVVTITLPCPNEATTGQVKKNLMLSGYCICELFADNLIFLPV